MEHLRLGLNIHYPNLLKLQRAISAQDIILRSNVEIVIHKSAILMDLHLQINLKVIRL
jgi:hypothetical protein